MEPDITNQYRAILEEDSPDFLDRVNTPWEVVPDLEDYNRTAYNLISRTVKKMSRPGSERPESNSQGILILGEAGTGKTHLLMRVARTLAKTNHILFIRKPNNEEAVAQHIWANIVSSLARTLPEKNTKRSQLDDLLAHVFSKVLIPAFEQDILDGKDAEQKQRWINRLNEDPFNLFIMLGEGERRQDNMDRIRKRTLRFLQNHHPDVNQKIAHVLITYCLVAREDRKRVLLTWLAGQDVDEAEAEDLGLPSTWFTPSDDTSDNSIAKAREDQALQAIRSIGILSTYYQPLILAFDQLEGLRDQHRLTTTWGDVVREIFTMAPNFLVITCIFPSLWETWFSSVLDTGAKERIAQQTIRLETFGPQHGLKMLATHLEPSFVKHRLPTAIFPFTSEDVQALCQKATSPRSFIQSARDRFQAWLDESIIDGPTGEPDPPIVTQEEIDSLLRSTLIDFENSQRLSYGTEMVLEQDFFGRVKDITATLLSGTMKSDEFSKATYAHYVMPPNILIRDVPKRKSLCLAVMNSQGNSFAARIRNMNKCLQENNQFTNLIIIRDRRCKPLGVRSLEHVKDVQKLGAIYIEAGQDEITLLNAIYETLVATEEHDLTIRGHEIDKKQLVGFLQNERILNRTELYRNAGRSFGPLSEVTGFPGNGKTQSPGDGTDVIEKIDKLLGKKTVKRTPSKKPLEPPPPPRSMVDVLIGDDTLDSSHVGILGELRAGDKKLGISLTKPQCLVLLGHMGSGKSYALGVLIENALLSQPGLIKQPRPMCVIAFNYRRNAESRFEYGGFAVPNNEPSQLHTLAERFGGKPDAVSTVNVFAYEEEIRRRTSDYSSLNTFPIKFKSDELSAVHWEILMKPPSREAEYMDIIRAIIQKLHYQERLTFKNLERAIQTDDRLSNMQLRKALNRLAFAEQWIADDRDYEWSDVLNEGSLNVFDLRMQAMESSEALKLCLIITDLIRSTKNGVNKVVVFDEAHEYVDSKELVGELENAITQIRHDGLSFVLASQYPDRIPERIFKYLLTRFIFKMSDGKSIAFMRRMAPNLDHLSPQRIANLDLEQGLCFVQSDEVCSDDLLRLPQELYIRPRCTLHGGTTIRHRDHTTEPSDRSSHIEEETEHEEFEDIEAEHCPQCGQVLVQKRSKRGPVMVCSDYPSCRYHRDLD